MRKIRMPLISDPEIDEQISDEPEKLITFGQLCAIKREAMGLSRGESRRRHNITNIGYVESGETVPFKKTIQKLVKFYNITEEELNSCKMPIRYRISRTRDAYPVKQKTTINTIILQLDELHDKALLLNDKGILASTMKHETIQALSKAKEFLVEIIVMDRLL